MFKFVAKHQLEEVGVTVRGEEATGGRVIFLKNIGDGEDLGVVAVGRLLVPKDRGVGGGVEEGVRHFAAAVVVGDEPRRQRVDAFDSNTPGGFKVKEGGGEGGQLVFGGEEVVEGAVGKKNGGEAVGELELAHVG